MKRTIAALILALISLMSAVPAFAAGNLESSREIQKGFFSFGAFYGMGASRYLNKDGSFTNYKGSLLGADLDIMLFDSGAGDVRAFVRYQMMTDGEANAGETIDQRETTVGLKFYVGSHLYLAGSMGPGTTTLSSETNGTSISMKYDVMRAAMGLEVGLTDSIFMALEADYRSANIRVNRNPDLTDNTALEGIGGMLRLIWSPPSVTINNYSK
jgi:hypothetical protein